MTERKPAGMTYESWIDKQIRTAQERGEFDDLPGAGKPIPRDAGADTALSWVKSRLDREGLSSEALLPEPVRLRKEVDRLPETVREVRSEESVREIVDLLNERIVAWMRKPSAGPQLPLSRVDAKRVVRQWREARSAAVAEESQETSPSTVVPPARPRWWRRGRGRR